jgi:hypothetical protein
MKTFYRSLICKKLPAHNLPFLHSLAGTESFGLVGILMLRRSTPLENSGRMANECNTFPVLSRPESMGSKNGNISNLVVFCQANTYIKIRHCLTGNFQNPLLQII